MLAVALNYAGGTGNNDYGLILSRYFSDFKVIKIIPYQEPDKGELQLCQPIEYPELIKNIQQSWDPSQRLLELRGIKSKLQRAVRQMCFFDAEKKFTRVFLDGSDGIDDFPWALQMVIIEPSAELDQCHDLVKQADVLVLNNWEPEASQSFVARVKEIQPRVPIFTEVLQESLSTELKDRLTELFTEYLEKRSSIKRALDDIPKKEITCQQAYKMAAKLKADLYLFGNVCDEYGYSITRCRLGCF
ncbi:MAG: hypothetical protein ACOX6I_04000 [Syntrophomonadaceae bacterium]|jgi:hypothetical protein